MDRDVENLRRAALAVSDDLRRTLPGRWGLAIDGDFVLTVQRDDEAEQVALDRSIPDDTWPAEAFSSKYRASTLQDDAAEVVMENVVEVLNLWGVRWPVCTDHGAGMEPCGVIWVCQRAIPHDVLLGDLGK